MLFNELSCYLSYLIMSLRLSVFHYVLVVFVVPRIYAYSHKGSTYNILQKLVLFTVFLSSIQYLEEILMLIFST